MWIGAFARGGGTGGRRSREATTWSPKRIAPSTTRSGSGTVRACAKRSGPPAPKHWLQRALLLPSGQVAGRAGASLRPRQQPPWSPDPATRPQPPAAALSGAARSAISGHSWRRASTAGHSNSQPASNSQPRRRDCERSDGTRRLQARQLGAVKNGSRSNHRSAARFPPGCRISPKGRFLIMTDRRQPCKCHRAGSGRNAFSGTRRRPRRRLCLGHAGFTDHTPQRPCPPPSARTGPCPQRSLF